MKKILYFSITIKDTKSYKKMATLKGLGNYFYQREFFNTTDPLELKLSILEMYTNKIKKDHPNLTLKAMTKEEDNAYILAFEQDDKKTGNSYFLQKVNELEERTKGLMFIGGPLNKARNKIPRSNGKRI